MVMIPRKLNMSAFVEVNFDSNKKFDNSLIHNKFY